MRPSGCRGIQLALGAFALLAAGASFAQEYCRYYFVTPTFEGFLRKHQAVRLVVVMRDTGNDARNAAKSLSLDVRRRGVQVVIMGAPKQITGQELAITEGKDKDAQLVALIEVQTDVSPKVATAELRDRSGEKLAIFISEATGDETCRAESAPAITAARDPFDEERSSSDEHPLGSRLTAEEPTAPTPARTWYGWQVAIADVGTLLVHYTPAGQFAWVTYAFGPLAVHAANGQGTRAALSFGLRLATPLVTAGVGVLAVYAGICPKEGDRVTCEGGLVAGPFIAGMVLAALADAGLLAWKPADEPGDRADAWRPRHGSGVTFGIGMLPYRRGAGLGVGGRF